MDIRTLWIKKYEGHGHVPIQHAPLTDQAFPRSFNMSVGLVQLDPVIREMKRSFPSKKNSYPAVREAF